MNIALIIAGGDGQAYNVSANDEGKTLGDYARLIANYANTEVVFDLSGKDNKGVSKSTYAIINCDKLKALGWYPLYSVSEGLKRTIDILS